MTVYDVLYSDCLANWIQVPLPEVGWIPRDIYLHQCITVSNADVRHYVQLTYLSFKYNDIQFINIHQMSSTKY